jgi:hypothetical protein
MKILAYGSLMNQQSLGRALGRPDVKLRHIVVNDYARIFNAPFFGLAYLNLVPSLGSVIEAAYFELDEQELEKFKEREAGSELVEVAPGLVAFVWPTSKTKELPVAQSYIDFCEAAASILQVDMGKGWITPTTIIDDRHDPKYPDMGQ